MSSLMTLSRFNLQRKRDYEGASGDFTLLMNHLALACKVVSREVARAGLLDVLGKTGTENVQGEQVTKLDVLSNEMLIEVLNDLPMVAAVASEEDEQIRLTRAGRLTGRYLISFDPLDGSSNIDVNATIGTIFSVRKRDTVGTEATAADFCKAGTAQIAAGYCVYGSSTLFAYSTGDGVDGFTLDPNVGEFVLSHPDMRIPDLASCWSANVGNSRNWLPQTHEFVAALGSGEGRYRKCSLRYIGTLVADVHRNLIQGGVFFYPGDKKSPNGKLRLLYEAHPLAYLVEQAGGKATDGTRRIMDLVPDGLHMRTPLVIGNAPEVDLYSALQAAHNG